MWPKIGYGLSTGDIRVNSPNDEDVCSAFQAVSARNRGDGRLARTELSDFLKVLLLDMLPREKKNPMPLVSASALVGTVAVGFGKHLVATRIPFSVGEVVLRFLPSTFLLGPLLGAVAAFRLADRSAADPEHNSAAVLRRTRRGSGGGPAAVSTGPGVGGSAANTILSGQAPRSNNANQSPDLYSPQTVYHG